MAGERLFVDTVIERRETLGVFTATYLAHVPTTGITSATLQVSLAKNTIVRQFRVMVTADRAQQTKAITAAQVRAYATPSGHTAVIDFGVPRTLNAISVTSANITSVQAWTGAAFGNAFYARGSGPNAIFTGEVRAERFLVTLSNAIARLEDEMIVELPELPTDLEIRINGGAPAWTNSGPVQKTTNTELSTEFWNTRSQRLVDLSDALNALLADPLSSATVPLEIKVTTKVPGVLSIAEQARSLSYINRVLFNADTEKIIDFAEEGVVEVPLELPSSMTSRRIEEVRLTAIANLAEERIMPAVGPAAAGLGELVIDSGHAACVRLSVRNDDEEELDELAAVRIPLAAEGDGAEVRVVLWSNEGTVPSAPLPNGVSKPVTLTASADAVWTRFEFPKPVKVDAANPPWVAVLASRGTAAWALADSAIPNIPRTADDALVARNVVLRGGPNGPWEALPPPFGVVGGFAGSVGRVRVAGKGAKEAPVAPLLLSLSQTWTPVTPTVKGVPLIIAAGNLVSGNPRLSVVSRTAGAVTLRDVDVVWHPELTVVAQTEALSTA